MPIDLPERFTFCDLRIRHYGYLKARIEERDKNRRNLELLERELAGDPRNPFTLFNIGTEFVSLGDHGRARDHLERSYAEPRRSRPGGSSPSPRCSPSASSASAARPATWRVRRRLAKELEQVFPGFTDLTYERGLAPASRRPRRGARLFARCLKQGDAPARFAGTCGHGSFLALAALAGARDRRAPTSTAAVAWLRARSVEHPDYLPAGLYLATTLLARPDADADERARRLERHDIDKLTWWLFLGTAFYERGHAEIAEGLFRRALARGGSTAPRASASSRRCSPSGATPRSRRSRGRPAGRHPRRSRRVPRSRVLAGASWATGRPSTSRPPPVQRRRRARLARASSAGAVPPATTRCSRCSRGAAPRVVRMLEALARLEEFDAFARVRPAARGAIGDRTGDVVLGELYLRAASTGSPASTPPDARSTSAARPRARWRSSARRPWRRACSRTRCPCSRVARARSDAGPVRRLLDDLATRDAA